MSSGRLRLTSIDTDCGYGLRGTTSERGIELVRHFGKHYIQPSRTHYGLCSFKALWHLLWRRTSTTGIKQALTRPDYHFCRGRNTLID
ncbi:hypothetical protein KC330_g16 [Hortaea werneckii]|nr:hypothetical protein KC330_g16 [Hortaea werneckii]